MVTIQYIPFQPSFYSVFMGLQNIYKPQFNRFSCFACLTWSATYRSNRQSGKSSSRDRLPPISRMSLPYMVTACLYLLKRQVLLLPWSAKHVAGVSYHFIIPCNPQNVVFCDLYSLRVMQQTTGYDFRRSFYHPTAVSLLCVVPSYHRAND